MATTTTAWLALDAGGGPFVVGLTLAARMLPALLFGLAAGTLADRVDRSRQLLGVALAAVPVMIALGAVAGSGRIQAWQLTALSFATGCLPVFDAPARQALVVDTVPAQAAANALALNAFASRLLQAVGALVAGWLIVSVGAAGSYPIVAAAYALAGGLVLFVRSGRTGRGSVAQPPFHHALRDAVRLIATMPAVRTLMLAGIACEVFGFSYASALPVVARDVLAAGAEGLGTLNAAAAIGGTIAVLLLSALPGGIRREPALGAVFMVYGASLVALAATHSFPVAVVWLGVIGACAAAFDVLEQTLIQLAVPDSTRGRAVGIWVLGTGSAPVGHLEMGALVSLLGAPSALLLNGCLVAATAATLLAGSPAYRGRGAPPAGLRSDGPAL